MAQVTPQPARRRGPDKIGLAIFVVLLLIGVGAGLFVYNQVYAYAVTASMVNLPGAPVEIAGGVMATSTPMPGETQIAIPTPQTNIIEIEPWDGTSRINVLVMGLDYRDWEKGETPRTDTMMLLTLDPLSKTAGMLSIPRDMWVNIPGFDYGRINTAYFLGEMYKVPGGGPALAAQTVENFIGVPVNFYAQVDFYAFIKFIDHLGGLDMYIRKEIKVDPLGPGNTVVLKPGVQPLSGAVALGYARQRYTEGGDFDRAQRQQDVIMAIRQQILTLNMMPTLIAKSPQMYADISTGVRTNLTLDQVIRIALLALEVPEWNIHRGIINPPDQVLLANSADGQAVLIPVPDRIRLLRDEIFTTGGPVSPAAASQDQATLIKTEAARVKVLNGSGTPDLTARTTQFLRGQGLDVVIEGNAKEAYKANSVVVHTGKPYTISYLIKTFNIPDNMIVTEMDEPNPDCDLEIIVGSDWAQNNPMP